MNIAIIGRTNILLKSAYLLNLNNFKIKVVISAKESDHEKTNINDFKKMAKFVGAEFIKSQNINKDEVFNKIKKYDLDLGISFNYPKLINKKIISLFKNGILNGHPGDLPRYRGNACPNWAIINGEKKIALTIHFMDFGLDSGDVVLKKYFLVKNNSTITDFYQNAETEFPKLFLKSALKIMNKTLKTKKQIKNPKKSLRCYPRNKFDGKIDWDLSANCIYNLIRASGEPFFGAYTFFNSKKLFILDSLVEKPTFPYVSKNGQVVDRRHNGEVVISCAKDFLVLRKIKYKNKIFEKPTDLIKTIYTRLGMNVEEELERILKLLQK